jgi:hypothetical protein
MPILSNYLRARISLANSETMQFLFHAILFRITGLSQTSFQSIGEVYHIPELANIIAQYRRPKSSSLQKYVPVLRGFIEAIEV